MARLAVPGVAGALLASALPMQIIAPMVSAYLFCMGGLILWRAFRPPRPEPGRKVTLLGLTGGFLDAAGGGGWGPIVTSTLIGRGDVPRIAIGSTNAAEFFVTLAITAAFFTAIGLELWQAILGLVVAACWRRPSPPWWHGICGAPTDCCWWAWSSCCCRYAAWRPPWA